MARPPRPVFLERNSYRRRRIMDAMRLVVVLGAVLWLMPVLWPDGAAGHQAVSMSRALFYVFGVWGLLIVLAALFSTGGLKETGAAEAKGNTEDEA